MNLKGYPGPVTAMELIDECSSLSLELVIAIKTAEIINDGKFDLADQILLDDMYKEIRTLQYKMQAIKQLVKLANRRSSHKKSRKSLKKRS